MEEPEGLLFNVQYFCVHDGPGIRTTVFLKGCPLRCLWCHNPEGIARQRQLVYSSFKCVQCGACVEACPEVHKIESNTHTVNRSACTLKGACVEACPAKALEIMGKAETVPGLMAKILKDKHFYDESGGGLTVSGGEPTLQTGFLQALLKAAKEAGLHTALETSGFSNYENYKAVLPYTDLFLFDWKETDPEKHKEFTGVENALIRENLCLLHNEGAKILLRCPIIPGLNDREDHFKGIAELAKNLPNLLGVEVLPYHDLASSKTGRLGMENQQSFTQPDAETAALWRESLKSFGAPVVVN